MPTTYTAQYLNARHHQTGTQVTDKDGHTWTRINTTHATYWDSLGNRCYNLPKIYEPYTYKNTQTQTFREELTKNAELFLTHERAFHDQPRRSQGLFQTIPPTWTNPTNLLPKANWEEIYKNWEDIYNHYKNLGQTNPEPLTKNIHFPHATTNGTQPDTNETDRALQHKVRETYLNMAQTNWVSPWIILNPQTTKD